MTSPRRYAVLRSPVSTVVLSDDADVPRVVHWGAPLADPVDDAALDALTDAPVPQGSLDATVPLSLLPELARGSGQALKIFKAETKGLVEDGSTSSEAVSPSAPSAPGAVAAAPEQPAAAKSEAERAEG